MFKRGAKAENLPGAAVGEAAARAEATPDVFEAGNEWEARHIHQVGASERRAWKVAYACLLSAILPWVAIVFMMPLKESVPYLIKQSQDGTLGIQTRVTWKNLSVDEAVEKSQAAQYVAARERYNWYTLQADYDLVNLLSSREVSKEFSALYEGDKAPDVLHSNKTRIDIQVLSVVPGTDGTMTVRYLAKSGAYDGTGKPDIKAYVSTLAFEFVNNSMLTEEERNLNPLGYVVTAYRRDTDQFLGVK
ncbi:type IV secretion system protein [Xanthomonas euvesicatoria pv. allii]|uniref:virB8 family protein n=1 Tax=Xanthomonas euvesicatoria TaxID=456327 RepID=UPI00240742AB|nr:type IV secretion system protein [Xanthomonas euvesicatoria pv. allii]